MKTAPCKECTKRTVGCHGSCEVYKEFRAKLDEKNEKIRKLKHREHVLNADRFRKSCHA